MARKLLAEERFQDAENLLNGLLSQEAWKGNEAFRGLLAEVGAAKEKAAVMARLQQAEETYRIGRDLLREGRVDEAEAAFRKVDTSMSRELAEKTAAALQKEIPDARAAQQLARGRLDLAQAEKLVQEGQLSEAEKLGQEVKVRLPALAGEVDRVMAKVQARREEEARTRQKEQEAREREALVQARGLIKGGRLDEAEDFLKGLLAQEAFKGSADLQQTLAEVGNAKDEAVRAARLREAEEGLAAAQALVDAGKIAEAEKALEAIPVDLSKHLADAVQKMRTRDIPAKQDALRTAEGMAQLARGETLLRQAGYAAAKAASPEAKVEDAAKAAAEAIQKFAAARAIAVGVKATFPPEVGQGADALLSKIEKTVQDEARKKLAKNQFQAARAFLKEYLQETSPEEASSVKALASKISEMEAEAERVAAEAEREKAEAQRKAKFQELEKQLAAGKSMLDSGRLDEAEEKIKGLLAELPEPLRADAQKALTKDIPDERARRKRVAEGKDDLAKAQKAFEEGQWAEARDGAEGVLNRCPELASEAKALRGKAEARLYENVSTLEREGMAAIQQQIDAGAFEEAAAMAQEFLQRPELAGNKAIQKVLSDLNVRKAEKQIADALVLAEQGKIDEAERILLKVDRTVSKDIGRKVDAVLQEQIPARKKEWVESQAGREKLAEAEAQLNRKDFAAARASAQAAAAMHPTLVRDAQKLLARVDKEERAHFETAKADELAAADRAMEKGQWDNAVQMYEKLKGEGYPADIIDARIAKAKKLREEGTIPAYASKVDELFAAAQVAHLDGDYKAEQAAYEAILVWDPENKKAKKLLEEVRANEEVWRQRDARNLQVREKEQQIQVLLTEAADLEALNKFDEALAKVDEALKADPEHRRALAMQKRLLGQTEGPRQALIQATEAQKQQRLEMVAQWFKEADSLKKAGRFDEAERLVNQVIALEARTPEATQLLADIRLSRRQQEMGTEVIEMGPPPEGVDPAEYMEAMELLSKLATTINIRRQEQQFQINTLCDQAEQRLSVSDWAKAGELLLQAEKIDPKSEKVLMLKAKLRKSKGIEEVTPEEVLIREGEERRVVIEMNTTEMQKLFREASDLVQNEKYDEAIDRLDKVKEILRTLPENEELKFFREDVNLKYSEVRELKAREDAKQASIRDDQARKVAEQQREEAGKRKEREIDQLLARARIQMEQENYGLAEEHLKELLARDPMNATARGLLAQLDRAIRDNRYAESVVKARLGGDELMTRVTDESTPQGPLMEYPADWKDIIAKRPTSVITEEEEPEWKRNIKSQMEKRISFDFVDTPLVDVVQFLNNLTGANFVLDPKAVAGQDTPVTLKVNDMRLGAAIEWILRLVNLSYTLKDEAIFISTKEGITDKVVMRLYDVRDLLATIPDFTGTGLPTISEGGGGGGGGGDDLFGGGDGEGAESFTGDDLVEFIKTTVAPSSWSEGGGEEEGAAGGTISYTRGKLVIVQTPDIHRQIEDLLSRFRESAAIQVHITARFIEVTENFLRSVGVSWPQLDQTDMGNRLTDLQGSIQSTVDPAPSLFDNTSVTGFAGSIGYFTDFQAQMVIQAATENQEINTLLAPELTCFNGQQARIAVVTQVRFIEDVEATTTSGGQTTSTALDFTIGTIEEGVNLLVRPTVSSDKRYVTLDLQPQVEDIIDIGRLDLTLGLDAAGNPLIAPIQLPEQSIKIIQTSVSVPDGGTLVIGGLIDSNDEMQKSSVPFIDRIPVLSLFVGQKNKRRLKRYLLIMIRANILIREEMEPEAG
ncbi:MAG: hypothetical protein HYU36_12950 [Planctomycetes bacterium]|nr:hypothetical protein [Planctomycetota bacterium]